jgi:hypothetical protein
MQSVSAQMKIDFNPDTLKLTVDARNPLPAVRSVDRVGTDFFGKAVGATRTAGPLLDVRGRQPIILDPRRNFGGS